MRPGFCVCEGSEDSRKRAAVDRQILPGDEGRLGRAQERAGGAEAVEIAQALGRIEAMRSALASS